MITSLTGMAVREMKLILLAISGLFMIRGRKGITGRGAWLTGLGIIIPAIFLLLYL